MQPTFCKVITINSNKAIIAFSIAGIILSSYMAYYHYQLRNSSGTGWCDLGKFINCENVLLSKYSEAFGIPVAYFGVLWFAAMFAMEFQKQFSSLLKKYHEPILFLWCVAGLAIVSFFVFVELFVLHSICILCTGVHVLVIAISIFVFKRMRLF